MLRKNCRKFLTFYLIVIYTNRRKVELCEGLEKWWEMVRNTRHHQETPNTWDKGYEHYWTMKIGLDDEGRTRYSLKWITTNLGDYNYTTTTMTSTTVTSGYFLLLSGSHTDAG